MSNTTRLLSVICIATNVLHKAREEKEKKKKKKKSNIDLTWNLRIKSNNSFSNFDELSIHQLLLASP